MIALAVPNAVRALKLTWRFFLIAWRRRGEEWRGFRLFLEDETAFTTRAVGPFVERLQAAQEDL